MDINIVAVLVAAIVGMTIGFVWYSPKLGFGKWWMAWNGIPADTPAPEGQGKLMLGGLVAQIVMAYVLAQLMVMTGSDMLGSAAKLALCIWVGFVATIQLGSVLWENKPCKLWFLNSMYWLVSLVVMAAILVLI